jgi:hypothetical protein
MHNIPTTSTRCLAMLRLCLEDYHARTRGSMATMVCLKVREGVDYHHEEQQQMACSDRHLNLTDQGNNRVSIHDNRRQSKEDTPMIPLTQNLL